MKSYPFCLTIDMAFLCIAFLVVIGMESKQPRLLMKALTPQGMQLGQLGQCSNLGRHSTPRVWSSQQH